MFNIISGCVCESVSGWEKHFNWTQWSSVLSPAWIGIIQSVENVIRTKGGKRRKLASFCFLSPCLSWDISSYFLQHGAFKPLAPLVSRVFKLRLSYTTSFPGSPACKWQIMGLLSFRNHVSQFITTNFFYRYKIYLHCIQYKYIKVRLNFYTYSTILFLWRSLSDKDTEGERTMFWGE